jgi:hypothetical protein
LRTVIVVRQLAQVHRRREQGCGVPSIFVAVVLLTLLSDSPSAVKTKFELVITLKAAKQVGFYNFSQRVGASG